MATMNDTARWAGIESESLDSNNWIQMAYRNSPKGFREYLVLGEFGGVRYEESYHSDSDDNKRLAYAFYYEQLEKLQ